MSQSSSCRKSSQQASKSGAPDSPVLGVDEQREAASILKAAPVKIEVDDRGFQEIVNQCVDSLDDDLRKLLRLNRWDGTSERAIACQTGLTVSAVHRRIQKALKNLKKSLEARGIDESWLNDRP